MNGYFQLIQKNDCVFLKIFKETDGGQPISLQEIVNYLSCQKISFDLKQLPALCKAKPNHQSCKA